MALLKGIQAEMTGFRNKLYLPHALHKTMKDFYSLGQGKHRNNQEYLDKFSTMVTTTEESRATTIGTHPGTVTEILSLTAADVANPTNAEHNAAVKTATDRYLAVAFLLGADRMRYGTLVKEIETNSSETRAALPLLALTQQQWPKPTTTYATTRRTLRTSRDSSDTIQVVT
jgi:hypothetical protein